MGIEEFFLQIFLILDSTLRLATPLILAALAGIFCERSGIIDIGLEGKMLFAAFAAAATAAIISQPEFAFNLTHYFYGTEGLAQAFDANPQFTKILGLQIKNLQEVMQVPADGSFLFSWLFSADQFYYGVRHSAPFWGAIAAIFFTILIAWIHGFACITHKGNQITSGVAINILAAGLAPTIAHSIFKLNGITPALDAAGRFDSLEFPFQETIGKIPILGDFYVETLSGHNIIVYLALLAIPFSFWILYRTRLGLRLRASGESPEAVDTAGISVIGMRYKALIITGIFCGLAGAYLSTAQGASFIRDMTAGKGFIALAAMVFGKWKPFPTLAACLIFAFADALQARLQGVEFAFIGEIPPQMIEVIPYVLTVLLLAGFVGQAIAPKALGKPYSKER